MLFTLRNSTSDLHERSGPNVHSSKVGLLEICGSTLVLAHHSITHTPAVFKMVEFKPQIPTNREFQGGDLLAQALKHLGTEVAFGLHGGHLDAFLVGAEECGIKLIDTRHETTAVQAAEGYAKISGKVGVCFVTANSG